MDAVLRSLYVLHLRGATSHVVRNVALRSVACHVVSCALRGACERNASLRCASLAAAMALCMLHPTWHAAPPNIDVTFRWTNEYCSTSTF